MTTNEITLELTLPAVEESTAIPDKQKVPTKVDQAPFCIYVLDTETTGLDPDLNDVIELSIYRLSDDTQKTWCIKPLNFDTIEAQALKINGHKLEDLKHETKYGRETYLSASKVIVEVENWMMEDGARSEDRILLGQNPSFDKAFLEKLWLKCNSKGTFPFGRKLIDTIQIVLLIDLARGHKRQAYGLGALVGDFGVKKEKAHRADADTRMTKDLWLKLLDLAKQAFGTGEMTLALTKD